MHRNHNTIVLFENFGIWILFENWKLIIENLFLTPFSIHECNRSNKVSFPTPSLRQKTSLLGLITCNFFHNFWAQTPACTPIAKVPKYNLRQTIKNARRAWGGRAIPLFVVVSFLVTLFCFPLKGSVPLNYITTTTIIGPAHSSIFSGQRTVKIPFHCSP